MSNRIFTMLLMIALFLTACGAGEQGNEQGTTLSATLVPTNTLTLTPTNTPEPTVTNTPEPTATPTLTPTPAPAGSEMISPENAAQVELLDWYIYGEIYDAFYAMDGEEKLASVLMTRTHLVGFSMEGEYLYELHVPESFLTFLFSGTGLPPNISGNQRYVALPSAEETYSVEVYDLATGELVQVFDHLVNFPQAKYQQSEWEDSSVRVMSFDLDGSLVATAYADNSISIWDMATGTEYSLPRTFQDARKIAFSEGNELLAVSTGWWRTSLTIFDISDLENIELQFAKNEVGQLVSRPFSKGNGFLVTAEDGRNAKYAYFDLEEMEMVERAGLPEGTIPVFSEDGGYLVFTPDWRAEDAESAALNLETRERTKDQEFIDSLLPEGEGWWDDLKEMKYDPSYFFFGQELQPYEDAFTAWSYTQYYTSQDLSEGSLWMEYWQLWESGKAVVIPLDGSGDTAPGFGSQFDQSGEMIFLCFGNQLLSHQIGALTDPVVLAENCAPPGVVAYDPSHNVVAYPVDSKLVEILDIESGEVLFQVRGYTRELNQLQFSDDGALLALKADPVLESYGQMDFSELMLFSLDYEVGKAEAQPLDLRRKIFEDYLGDVVLAGDGSYLAVGVHTQDAAKDPPQVYVWDFTGQGARRRAIPTWSGSMALSPDNAILAVAAGTYVKLYSVATSELLAEHEVPVGQFIRQLLFSRDGESLYVLIDGAICVWGVP